MIGRDVVWAGLTFTLTLFGAGCGEGGSAGKSVPTSAAANDGSPPKVVVHVSSGGSMDAESAFGVGWELTHWLEYSPEIIVRRPRRVGPGSATVDSDDVDHTIWISVGDDPTGATVRWSVTTGASATPALDTGSDLRAPFPRLPAALAAAVLSELGLDVARVPSDALQASDPNAYRDFLRLLGSSGAGGDPRRELRTRIGILEDLRERLPSYPAVATSLGAAYLDLAGLVGGQGPYYPLAEEELVRAFELDPRYPASRVKLASLFAKLGRSEESVEALVDGLATHPYFPGFHQDLGYVLRYAGLMNESMASYRRSQELDSSLANLVSAQDQITKSLIYLGDYDDALASHRRMLAFLEEAERTVNEKQWFYEGVIHLYAGNRDAAVHAFREGRKLDPESVWTTFGRAYEGMALGDPASVGGVLDELERREVVDGERHYRLVHFATFTGDVERALGHLRKTMNSGFFNAAYVGNDPWVAALRPDPRFSEMVGSAQARHDVIKASLAGRD